MHPYLARVRLSISLQFFSNQRVYSYRFRFKLDPTQRLCSWPHPVNQVIDLRPESST